MQNNWKQLQFKTKDAYDLYLKQREKDLKKVHQIAEMAAYNTR